MNLLVLSLARRVVRDGLESLRRQLAEGRADIRHRGARWGAHQVPTPTALWRRDADLYSESQVFAKIHVFHLLNQLLKCNIFIKTTRNIMVHPALWTTNIVVFHKRFSTIQTVIVATR